MCTFGFITIITITLKAKCVREGGHVCLMFNPRVYVSIRVTPIGFYPRVPCIYRFPMLYRTLSGLTATGVGS